MVEAGGGVDQRDTRPRALFHLVAARALAGEGALLFHHVGIYAYTRRGAGETASSRCRPPPLELREEARAAACALEAGMSIAVARVDSVPLSVDTPGRP